MTWEVVLTAQCELGEGPVWDDQHCRILWVDIVCGRIHQWYLEKRRHVVVNVGEDVGAIALRKNGGLVAALRNGFAEVDLSNGVPNYLAYQEHDLENNRFNDGKCDSYGRFWAGTMDDVSNAVGAGKLYALDLDYSVSPKIMDVTCSNGLAWSSDDRVFYFIDTPTRSVVAFDYAGDTGMISNKRLAISFSAEEGWPDGMTIDEEGMLWIAFWGGWKVVRWNPNTGEKLVEVKFPVSQITSCTFGGEDLGDLYVTTARMGLTNNGLLSQPYAGSLFVVRDLPCRGVPPYRFGG